MKLRYNCDLPLENAKLTALLILLAAAAIQVFKPCECDSRCSEKPHLESTESLLTISVAVIYGNYNLIIN